MRFETTSKNLIRLLRRKDEIKVNGKQFIGMSLSIKVHFCSFAITCG